MRVPYDGNHLIVQRWRTVLRWAVTHLFRAYHAGTCDGMKRLAAQHLLGRAVRCGI
jgi:hypothetical protein